ncbi:hypothetical protein Pmar_PMAR015662 [Perkinsus marinus ATCC 50983]|uniref:RING-type domain-containing protein n=1 Tax=Perkinsus marinus (strain ATCC 50983 / TXsc) TaxID=423536 RepID=C5K4A5_PERM5|nr:hypothetical protein Pmar_PMAR015662 [Perkinsus marinus ATCC 50983]EER20721.1 hypothetical protein Pmar_PMAR015662 [Perkinsus marinus ATCC 50983]|eukprot:XP_002788925.1 hypothetical protein Pmar_PMAR015662 [Perkinsus marinus ATCC 50983]
MELSNQNMRKRRLRQRVSTGDLTEGSKVDASKQLLKTRLCILYLEGKCKYGKKFAHGEHELCKSNPNTPADSRGTSPRHAGHHFDRHISLDLNDDHRGLLLEFPSSTHTINQRDLAVYNYHSMDDSDMQLVSGLVFPRLARRNSKQQDGSLIIPPVRTSTMHGHQHVNSQSKTSSLDHASQGLADLSSIFLPSDRKKILDSSSTCWSPKEPRRSTAGRPIDAFPKTTPITSSLIPNTIEPDFTCEMCESAVQMAADPDNRKIFYPCGHGTVCVKCADEVIMRRMVCPFCSSSVTHTLPVYIPIQAITASLP